MTRKSLLITLVAVCLVSSTAFAQGVVGTKHDLSATLGTSGQVCVFCHTPHAANDGPAGTDWALLGNTAPLWNQDLNDAPNNYGQYASDTFDALDISDITRATYTFTLLCLSCHDGSVAPGSFYNAPNISTGEDTSTAVALTGSANVGLSITDDHPVNFTYQDSIDQGDAGLHPAASVASFLDPDGKVQCTSCHDPHDETAADPNVDFMLDTLEASALCLNCHIK